MIPTILKEDEWLIFIHVYNKPKTKVINVISKCSNCILGVIQWNPGWRHYWFEPTIEFKHGYSDRCLIAIGEFVRELNFKHRGE